MPDFQINTNVMLDIAGELKTINDGMRGDVESLKAALVPFMDGTRGEAAQAYQVAHDSLEAAMHRMEQALGGAYRSLDRIVQGYQSGDRHGAQLFNSGI